MEVAAIAKAGKELIGSLDGIITSGEERGQARLKLREFIHNTTRAITESQASIILAEIKSDSWLAKNWRPIAALTFVFIVAWNYAFVVILEWLLLVGAQFGLPEIAPPPRLEMVPMFWAALMTMLGGYVGSRWHEKVKALESNDLDFGKGAGGIVNQKTIKRLMRMIRKEKDPAIRAQLVKQLNELTNDEPEAE